MGVILKDIQIPDEILLQLKESLLDDHGREQDDSRRQQQSLERRRASLQQRIDGAYQDKLDGKITEEYWQRRAAEWQTEELQILNRLTALEAPRQERLLNAARILELANKAYSLYVSQNPREQAKLLKMVLSNCALDAISLYPTYRKPFDLIFRRAKKEEWYARVDSNHRPFAPEANALSS